MIIKALFCFSIFFIYSFIFLFSIQCAEYIIVLFLWIMSIITMAIYVVKTEDKKKEGNKPQSL